MSRAWKFLGSLGRFPEVIRAWGLFEDGPEVLLRFLNPTRGNYPFVVRLRSSQYEVVCEDWHDLTTLWTVFTGGEYRVCEPSESICDLGANFGAFALWASMMAPQARIVAVEPHPKTYSRLKDNLKRWGLEQRVTAIQAALWTSPGFIGLDGREGTPSHSVQVIAEPNSEIRSLRVPSITVEQVLGEFGGSCDLLKMDIEGAEDEVICGMDSSIAQGVREFQIEYHGEGRRLRLEGKLTSLGFDRCFERRRGDCGVFHYVRAGK